ncbi:MAG: hypothetical protein EOM03_17895 [Clostridia bacterium]|nr:hypothetical protein [Clostridia bacterium]
MDSVDYSRLRNFKAVFRDGKLRKALHPNIAGQIETICGDIESIQSGDYKNLSIVCIGATMRKMIHPSESFNEMITRGAFPGIGSFESARDYALEAARNSELQNKADDWALNSRSYEDGQRYTRYLKEHCKPQIILRLILRLFPELERSRAWELAKEEHFRRLEVRRDISLFPDDWEADVLAEEAAEAALPTPDEEVGNSLGGWRRVARELAWNKIYDNVFRSVMARLHRVVTNLFMLPRRAARMFAATSAHAASKHRQEDDGGGEDSDGSDPEPPRLKYHPLAALSLEGRRAA